jgi:hypothetical protein
MSLADELLALEREGWEALTTGGGADYYRAHLAEQAWMAFPFGVLEREAAIEAMAAAPPWERFEITEPHAVALGEDAGVLVYRVVARRAGGEPYRAVIASTFVREDGAWRLAFHQQSP